MGKTNHSLQDSIETLLILNEKWQVNSSTANIAFLDVDY